MNALAAHLKNHVDSVPHGDARGYQPRQLVLLGGGMANLQVLANLAAHPLAEMRIILVAPHPRSIYPGMLPGGVDRSEGQLALLAQRNPDIAPLVSVRDMTMPWSSQWEVSDLVYSQAVIMHINTAVSHLVALSNMFRLARNHVVLMENYACHPFHEDVMRLFNGGQLGWSQIHAYAHRVDGQPYCLVYSREPQALPPLTDYMLLPGACEPKYM